MAFKVLALEQKERAINGDLYQQLKYLPGFFLLSTVFKDML